MSRAVEDSNRRLLRARDAMDGSYARPLDIAALARIAHVSEAHFIRTFRATFGETPHRYLQRRRVERAMFLLVQTDRSVTEICLDVGFTSLGTFSRTFRAIVGESPTQLPRSGASPTTSPTASRWRGRDRAVSEKPTVRRATSVTAMLNITHSSIFVLDQDEALDFYVGKLGFEVDADVDMGFMRWLTISAPGDPDREILLERPGPPAHDDATAEQVRELVTKGAAGFALGPADRRPAQDLRGAQGQGRRVHRRADRALLRHRLRAARPVRQQHPHRAAGAGPARRPRPRRVRPELTTGRDPWWTRRCTGRGRRRVVGACASAPSRRARRSRGRG